MTTWRHTVPVAVGAAVLASAFAAPTSGGRPGMDEGCGEPYVGFDSRLAPSGAGRLPKGRTRSRDSRSGRRARRRPRRSPGGHTGEEGSGRRRPARASPGSRSTPPENWVQSADGVARVTERGLVQGTANVTGRLFNSGDARFAEVAGTLTPDSRGRRAEVRPGRRGEGPVAVSWGPGRPCVRSAGSARDVESRGATKMTVLLGDEGLSACTTRRVTAAAGCSWRCAMQSLMLHAAKCRSSSGDSRTGSPLGRVPLHPRREVGPRLAGDGKRAAREPEGERSPGPAARGRGRRQGNVEAERGSAPRRLRGGTREGPRPGRQPERRQRSPRPNRHLRRAPLPRRPERTTGKRWLREAATRTPEERPRRPRQRPLLPRSQPRRQTWSERPA